MTDVMKWSETLQDMAAFVEDHEDLAPGYIPALTLNLFADTAEEMAEKARQLGACSKHESGGYYFLQKNFGPHSIQLNIKREQICERTQVGTQMVMKPAPDAPLIEVEEPVYEWICPDSVLAKNPNGRYHDEV